MSQLIHALIAMKWFKCFLCIIVFNNVGGASISIKLPPDMYHSHQQAYNWLIGWMNHLLYNRLGQYSIILFCCQAFVFIVQQMLCRLNEVKASFTVCLLQFMYDILFKKCKWLVQHLSVNLEKACVTVLNMYHVTKIQVWMKLKENILYHMHYIKPILLV